MLVTRSQSVQEDSVGFGEAGKNKYDFPANVGLYPT